MLSSGTTPCPTDQLSLQHGTSVLCENPVFNGRGWIRGYRDRDRLGDLSPLVISGPIVKPFKTSRGHQAGVLGKPKRLKSMVLWPRDFAYYNRNSWAGKVADSGLFILDSVAHNATAHTSITCSTSRFPARSQCLPLWIEAETYRANDRNLRHHCPALSS